MATSLRGTLILGASLVLVLVAGVAAWMRRPDAPVAISLASLAARPSTTPAAPPSQPSGQSPALQTASHPPVSPAPQAGVVVPQLETPHFDIVRVEPSGDTVVAGKGAPNTKVALLSKGAVVAETMTDASGHFVVLPPSLSPGDHSLSLRQTPANAPPSISAQSVTVSVPARGKGAVVIALAEPGRPTKVLEAPDAPVPSKDVAPTDHVATNPHAAVPAAMSSATSAPGTLPGIAGAKVAVRVVDLENGDGFHATGAAKPGTPLRLYLNNAHVADVVAGADGEWTMTIKKGLASGHYVVRADAEQPANPARKGSTVTARAEVPFDVPPPAAVRTSAVAGKVEAPSPSVATKSVSPPDARQPPPQGRVVVADAGHAVIEEIQTAHVVTGDNLWNISLSRLGHAERFTQIYAANEKQIRDPNLIYPGQVFVLPR